MLVSVDVEQVGLVGWLGVSSTSISTFCSGIGEFL